VIAMSLRLKLLLPFVILFIGLFVHSNYVLVPHYVEQQRDKQIALEQSYVELLAAALLPDLIESDLEDIHLTLDAVAKAHSHWSIKLVNAEKLRLYPVFETPEQGVSTLYSITKPISLYDQVFAELQLKVDLSITAQKDKAFINNLKNYALGILVLLFALVSLFLDSLIRKPMTRMASFANSIAKGNYQTPLPFSSMDEMGMLGSSLDSMRQKINERDIAMNQHVKVQEAIRFVQNKYISDQDTVRVFIELQRRILDLTECETGVIVELRYDKKQCPYLHALTLDESTEVYYGDEIPLSASTGNYELHPVDSLFGKVMLSGKPTVDQGPEISIAQLGFPLSNEIAIRNFMGLPLYSGSQLVGIQCLINQKCDFQLALFDDLQVLTQTVAQLIIAYRERVNLADKEIRLRQIIDHAQEGIISTDEAGAITSFNAAAERIFGYKEHQMIGHSVNSLVPEDDFQQQLKRFSHFFAPDREVVQSEADLEMVGLHKNGKTIPLEVSITRVISEAGLQYTGIMRDITERKQHEKQLSLAYEQLQEAHEQLEVQSHTDALTGLANRRFLDLSLQAEWEAASQHIDRPMSIILCDIDFFKKFNDNHGHLEGDECLKRIAAELAASFSDKDALVARYGGEEFLIMLPNTPVDIAVEKSEKMRQRIWALNYPHESSEIADRLTISVGVNTTQPSAATELTQAIERADTALYRAKAAGRNQVLHYKPDAVEAVGA